MFKINKLISHFFVVMNIPLGFAEFNLNNDIETKKTTETAIQKRRKNRDPRSKKVEKFLKSINSNDLVKNIGSMSDDDSDDDEYDNQENKNINNKVIFPPNPQLQLKPENLEYQQGQFRENNNNDINNDGYNDNVPVQRYIHKNDLLDEAVTNDIYNSLNNGGVGLKNNLKEYYQNYVPNSQSITNTQELTGSKDMLIDKLNYMIHLLEEQQEEKTGHVAEELILYSFLGVFIIFVIDSFARASKYVR